MNAVIEEVITKSDKIQPIIVNFQTDKPKDKIKNFSCDLVHNQTQNKTTLVISDGQDMYKGYKKEEKLMRTLLVLHNKRTGKVRLVEAEQWQANPITEKPVDEENKCEDTLWMDKVSSLTKQYGSKKAKRRTLEFEKTKAAVDVEQNVETLSNIEIDEADLSLKQPTNESEISFLPPCNKDATNVKDVYNIYDIIPKSKLETLYEHATEVLNGDIEGRSKFFKYTLRNIQSDPDNMNKVALLLYIEMINAWFNIPIKEMKKRNVVVCKFSEEVNQHVINTYSTSTVKGRMRPSIMMDKGLVHTLILALTVSDFLLNLELFQGMLKRQISLKKLISFARIIGALPCGKNKNTIILKVPLPAPISLVRRGRKKNSNK